jgi:hypothetical protein
VTQRDDDAAWQQIVENYGEAPALPDADAVPPAGDGPEPFRLEVFDEEFVPPPLPPPPVISPERRIAWVALVLAPVLLVVLNLIDFALPPVLVGGLVLAFLGSFGYLVATMSPHDPDDDGARV